MSKKKKTLKQKIVADLRHGQYRLETADSSEAVVTPAPLKSTPTTYAYLYQDLKKTTIVSFAIVSLQIVLYFLLARQILSLPFINY